MDGRTPENGYNYRMQKNICHTYSYKPKANALPSSGVYTFKKETPVKVIKHRENLCRNIMFSDCLYQYLKLHIGL